MEKNEDSLVSVRNLKTMIYQRIHRYCIYHGEKARAKPQRKVGCPLVNVDEKEEVNVR